jgi:type VI secretion system secreted protein VgrG
MAGCALPAAARRGGCNGLPASLVDIHFDAKKITRNAGFRYHDTRFSSQVSYAAGLSFASASAPVSVMQLRPRPAVRAAVSLAAEGAWSQQTRFLRLHTPLGPDQFLVESFEGRDALDEGYRYTVTALSRNAHIDLDAFIGQPVLLELLTALSRSDYRPFHGHVTRIEKLGSDGGWGRYRLTLEPWFAFLRYRQDSFSFLDKSVIQIVDEIFADYVGGGQLTPAWRWELKDPAVYKPRSLCTQYEESDHHFVCRLLAEEGLFYWFEHEGDANSKPFGRHVLVIADHNGAFSVSPQPQVEYKRADPTETDDTLQRLFERTRLVPSLLEMSSWDYRSVQDRPVSTVSRVEASEESIDLPVVDHPGQYAYADTSEGERYLKNQIEALEARVLTYRLLGTYRCAAPGRTVTVLGHIRLNGDGATLAISGVDYQARNNLHADAMAGHRSVFDEPILDGDDGPLFQCRIQALPASVPWRPQLEDDHGRYLHPKPTVRGSQTAIVVGHPGAPLTGDRDYRIKIQFHWQRGSKSHSHQDHPTGADNAPADAGAGTWVRVLAPQAGANWGGNFLPRIGQEVMVTFLEGDADRPLVLGALYNGRGQDNSQANGIGTSAGAATSNAPAWFPGIGGDGQSSADVEDHAHQAVFSGFKSQELSASQSGQGGYNALVFDDTPKQAGVRLSTSQFNTALNLGRLKQQTDNRRQVDRGHGLELKTDAYGAVRAGSGLLISADARPNVRGTQMDGREAQAQLAQAQELSRTLTGTAQQHRAKLDSEPAPDKLPAAEQFQATKEALQATDQRGEAGSQGATSAFIATGGGSGTVPAWASPLLTFSAPAGLGFFTPADAVLTAGQTLTLTTGQDINLVAQGDTAWAVAKGIGLFTYGKASNASKPNQETGIKLHAGTGSVSMQSQTDETRLTADKTITVASTTKSVQVAAKKHVFMTAAGAFLKIEGGNIQLHGPGAITFLAGQKNLTGPAFAGESLTLPKPKAIPPCAQKAASAASGGAGLL